MASGSPSIDDSGIVADVLDRLAEAVTIVGADGRRHYVNAAAAAVLESFGLSLDGRPLGSDGSGALDTAGELVPSERLPVERTRTTGEAVSDAELGFAAPDGSRRWLRMSTRPLDDDGPPFAVVSSFTDITDSRHVGAALEAPRVRYGDVVDALHEGVVLQDSDGRILDANARAEQLLGMTSDQMAGLTALDPRWTMVRADGAPMEGSESPSQLVVATGEAQLDQLVGVRSGSAAMRWLQVSALPLHDGGVVATFVDVTERLVREEDLRRATELFAPPSPTRRSASPWSTPRAAGCRSTRRCARSSDTPRTSCSRSPSRTSPTRTTSTPTSRCSPRCWRGGAAATRCASATCTPPGARSGCCCRWRRCSARGGRCAT